LPVGVRRRDGRARCDLHAVHIKVELGRCSGGRVPGRSNRNRAGAWVIPGGGAAGNWGRRVAPDRKHQLAAPEKCFLTLDGRFRDPFIPAVGRLQAGATHYDVLYVKVAVAARPFAVVVESDLNPPGIGSPGHGEREILPLAACVGRRDLDCPADLAAVHINAEGRRALVAVARGPHKDVRVTPLGEVEISYLPAVRGRF
jgi:hypothetical protein